MKQIFVVAFFVALADVAIGRKLLVPSVTGTKYETRLKTEAQNFFDSVPLEGE